MYLSGVKINILKTNRWDNAIDLCFFDQACINRRNAAEAAANQQLAQQQQQLQNALNLPTGGLKTGAIVGIIIGLLGLTTLTIYLINRHKI